MCIELNHKCYCSRFDWRQIFFFLMEKLFIDCCLKIRYVKKYNELPEQSVSDYVSIQIFINISLIKFIAYHMVVYTYYCYNLIIMRLWSKFARAKRSGWMPPSLFFIGGCWFSQCVLWNRIYICIAFLRYTMFSLWKLGQMREKESTKRRLVFLLYCWYCYCYW